MGIKMRILVKYYKEVKAALYFENNILVPVWTNYLATDADGTINAFSHKPVMGDDGEWWYKQCDNDYQHCYACTVGLATLESTDWRDTLVDTLNKQGFKVK